jgi:hypothetical protein
MQVAFAIFADAANLSQEGKLNVLGMFDALQVAAFPAVHPRAHLVVHLKGTVADVGTHALSLRWVNPHGQELWESTGNLDVGQPPSTSGEMDLPVIAMIDLPMDIAGRFQLVVSLDGSPIAQVPVLVRQVATPTAMSGGRPSGLFS